MALCKSESIPQVLSASRGTKIQSAQLGQNITCVVARACHGTRIKYHNGCFLFVYAAQGNMHMWPWSHSSSAYAPAHQNEIWAKIVIFGTFHVIFLRKMCSKMTIFAPISSWCAVSTDALRRFGPLPFSGSFAILLLCDCHTGFYAGAVLVVDCQRPPFLRSSVWVDLTMKSAENSNLTLSWKIDFPAIACTRKKKI